MTDRTKNIWGFWQPGGERGEIDEFVTFTEQEILDFHWLYWKERMVEKYGEDHYLITEQNCIDDWAIENYATQVEP